MELQRRQVVAQVVRQHGDHLLRRVAPPRLGRAGGELLDQLGPVRHHPDPAAHHLQEMQVVHREVLGPRGAGEEGAPLLAGHQQRHADRGADAEALDNPGEFIGVPVQASGAIRDALLEDADDPPAIGERQPVQADGMLAPPQRRVARAPGDQGGGRRVVEEGVHLVGGERRRHQLGGLVERLIEPGRLDGEQLLQERRRVVPSAPAAGLRRVFALDHLPGLPRAARQGPLPRAPAVVATATASGCRARRWRPRLGASGPPLPSTRGRD